MTVTLSTSSPSSILNTDNFPRGSLPRAIFLDSGGVINDNDRRGPQWVHYLERYMPQTSVGGPGELWGKANTIMLDRLFSGGQESMWDELMRRSTGFNDFERQYFLFWIQTGVELINTMLKEDYEKSLSKQMNKTPGSSDHHGLEEEKVKLVQLDLPETEDEQIQIVRDAHLHCTGLVRADYPGAVDAILTLKFDQGFEMYTCSGETAVQLELTFRTLGISALTPPADVAALDAAIAAKDTTDVPSPDLRPVFTGLYGPDLIQCQKSSSRFYELIFEDSGVHPRDAVVVDDKEYILGWAKVHGARTVLISDKNRTGKELKVEVEEKDENGIVVGKREVLAVDHQLGSLAELPVLTAAWKAQLERRSNAHYVGYVEENESIEAIMKKFEELARIEEEIAKSRATASSSSAASSDPAQGQGAEGLELSPTSGSGSGLIDNGIPLGTVENGEVLLGVEKVQNTPDEEQGFTDEQLQEIFRRTSGFTVRSMLRDTPEDIYEEDMWQANIADEDYLYDFEEEDDYLMAMDDHFWDEEVSGSRKRGRKEKEPRPPRLPKEPKIKGERKRGTGSDRETILQRYKVMQVRLQDRNGVFYTVKKKISTMDPSLPTYVRIPPVPIPRSWIQPIRTLEKQVELQDIPGSRYEESTNILEMNLTRFGTNFQAIYMDPPLLREGEAPEENKITMEQLSTIDVSALLPRGFLFVWLEKEFLPDMVRLAEKWEMRYVENFCWIKKTVNNQIATERSPYFNSSKLSLLIFRKEGEVDIRHQRSPDCVFDFIKPSKSSELSEEKPAFMYELIETLLPQAVYSDSNPNGDRMLEL
ncbi:hypothetical protein EDD11_001750 [Mortierella claussenii]|nr:hypothetical protein EDD11_001750 [Mortierella claussenii]